MKNAESKSSKTSKKTLAHLRTSGGPGLPDPEQFESILAKFTPSNANITKSRQDKTACTLYPQWLNFLKQVVYLLKIVNSGKDSIFFYVELDLSVM